MKVVIASCHNCRIDIRPEAVRVLYGSDEGQEL
jgi:hypothetical protein